MMRTLVIILNSLIAFSLFGQSEVSKAEALMMEGNYLEAISLAAHYLETDSSNLQCIQLIAKASNTLGDQANAKKYYHKLEKLDSSNVDTYIQLASIYELQQRTPRAIKYYSLLNKLLPENPIYFRKNAQLYKSANDNLEAFRLYAIANKLNPRDVLTLRGLAEICITNNQMDMADSLIQAGLYIDDDNISMHYILARSKYIQKQYDSVTFILEGLQGKIDLDNYYNKLLGFSYLQIDSIDLAIQKLRLAIVPEEQSEKLHYYLASAYEKTGEMSGALEHYEKAAEFGRSADLDLYHRNIARLASNEKKYKKAIEHYQDAYRYSEDPVILYYLATICDTYYKDKSIAINYYKKYQKSKHSNIEFQEYAKNRSRFLLEQQHQSK